MYNTEVFKWKNMSGMRKTYFIKFAFRCFALILTIALCISKSEVFDVMEGMNFFRKVSVLHIL